MKNFAEGDVISVHNRLDNSIVAVFRVTSHSFMRVFPDGKELLSKSAKVIDALMALKAEHWIEPVDGVYEIPRGFAKDQYTRVYPAAYTKLLASMYSHIEEFTAS
jgi:hypothetical protein